MLGMSFSGCSRLLALPSTAILLALLACGGGGSGGTPTGPTGPSNVVVTIAAVELPIGDTLQAFATVTDSRGKTIADVVVNWSSSDPSVLSVTSSGAVRGLKVGKATVAATVSGSTGGLELSVRQPSFIQRFASGFVLDGKPFRVAGANSAVATSSIDVFRVESALSEAAAMGVRVVRLWGASEIGSLDGAVATLGAPEGLRPYYQYWDAANGRPAYNDGPDGIQVLDHAVAIAKQSGIRLVISLVDNWSWYWGGADQYVLWYAKSLHGDFYTDPSIRRAYKDWISHLLNHVNAETGLRYADDPTIMAWELGNEVTCYGDGGVEWQGSACRGSDVESWVADVSAYVRSLDSRHLIAIGDVGFFAGKADAAMGYPYSASNEPDFAKTILLPNIDYGTYHAYPHDFQNGTLPPTEWGKRFIQDHIAEAKTAGKPAVLEEFGARDPALLQAALDAWLMEMSTTDGGGFMFYQVGARLRDGSPAWMDGYSLYASSPIAPRLATWLKVFDTR
jgi:mannan endo-1,4-beta-mannosidase